MSVVYEVVCDHCGEPEGTSHQTDKLAVESAAEAGWLYDPDTGHKCPSCQEEPE